jgi:predicted negative regulator of RcsB-dependent stress response
MAESASTGTLEESLNSTDFGHWLYEYRKAFIAAIGVVFVAASGWLLWKQAKASQLREMASQVHRFETANLEELRSGKIAPAEFVTRFSALDADVRSSTPMVPVALQASQIMNEKGSPAEALAVLKPLADNVAPKDTAFIFLAHNYATLAENNGQSDEAIKVLEAYVASGHKVFLVKAYLDLGRLYLAKNDATSAKKNLDYIVANHPNDELAKMARLYLQRVPAAK